MPFWKSDGFDLAVDAFFCVDRWKGREVGLRSAVLQTERKRQGFTSLVGPCTDTRG